MKSALLPMGGAVSGWRAPTGCSPATPPGVNPLNGEGIDYGLETGRHAAELFAAGSGIVDDVSGAWVDLLSYRVRFGLLGRPPAGGLLTAPGSCCAQGPGGDAFAP